jgi:hypothetical protein
MPAIRFDATLSTIGPWTILRLPEETSAKLPSRGQTMAEGAINGFHFQIALEPDGKGSHWFKVDESLRTATGAHVGDTVTVSIERSKNWPEPTVPEDWKKALAADPPADSLWTALCALGAIPGAGSSSMRNSPKKINIATFYHPSLSRFHTVLPVSSSFVALPSCEPLTGAECLCPTVSRDGVSDVVEQCIAFKIDVASPLPG